MFFAVIDDYFSAIIKDSFGRTQIKPSIKGLATPKQVLKEQDVLVIYGDNKHINQFLRSVGVKIK